MACGVTLFETEFIATSFRFEVCLAIMFGPAMLLERKNFLRISCYQRIDREGIKETYFFMLANTSGGGFLKSSSIVMHRVKLPIDLVDSLFTLFSFYAMSLRRYCIVTRRWFSSIFSLFFITCISEPLLLLLIEASSFIVVCWTLVELLSLLFSGPL